MNDNPYLSQVVDAPYSIPGYTTPGHPIKTPQNNPSYRPSGEFRAKIGTSLRPPPSKPNKYPLKHPLKQSYRHKNFPTKRWEGDGAWLWSTTTKVKYHQRMYNVLYNITTKIVENTLQTGWGSTTSIVIVRRKMYNVLYLRRKMSLNTFRHLPVQPDRIHFRPNAANTGGGPSPNMSPENV